MFIFSCRIEFLKTYPLALNRRYYKRVDRFINYESESYLDEAILYRKNVAYFKIKQGNDSLQR